MQSEGQPRSGVRALWFVVGVAFVARVVLWAVSEGSNDARLWHQFAREIAARGVLDEYVKNGRFNHPPLMGLWSVVALKASVWTGIGFAKVFKLLPLAADALALLALRAWASRTGRDVGVVVGVAATSVVAILTSAYHGNTDNACAALVLCAALLVDAGAAPFVAGLVFAASLNVKLIPLVVAPALFLVQARTMRDGVRFLLGMSLGLLPFVVPVVAVGAAFYKNAIAYNSFPNRWGIHFLLDEAMKLSGTQKGGVLRELDVAWQAHARYVIMAASALLGLHARRFGRSAVEVTAAALAMFLVLAPGIGVQYFVYPAMALAAVSPLRGGIYGVSAAAFIGCAYVSFSPLLLPLASYHKGPYPVWVGVVGVVTWCVLIESVVAFLRRTAKPPSVAAVGDAVVAPAVDPAAEPPADPLSPTPTPPSAA
jgi:hypothetical protein